MKHLLINESRAPRDTVASLMTNVSTRSGNPARAAKNCWIAAATASQLNASSQSLLSHWTRRQAGCPLWRSF